MLSLLLFLCSWFIYLISLLYPNYCLYIYLFTYLYEFFDILYLEEAPDKLENGTINFKKMGLIGTLLNELHQFQSLQHSFSPIYPIQEFLLSSGKAALDEIQLYTISKTIEPRKET